MPKLIRITTAPLSLKYLLFNQMKYMSDHGFEVIMVSSEGKEWPDLLKNEGCDYRIIHMTRKITPFTDIRSLWKLYRLFRKEKPDIVHSHTPKAGLLAMMAARMAGIKIRVHTIAGLRYVTAKGMKRKVLVSMEKLTGTAARYVWPNSLTLRNYIREHHLINEKKLTVIGFGSSNGVDLKRFSPAALDQAKLSEIKRSLNYDENLCYLLNMGRIVKDKGIDEVLNAFVNVHASDPNLRLIMLGAFEEDLDPISDEAKEILKTHPAIIHIEWSDHVEYFMYLSHLLIHASYREGFPNTLLQAGAMHCPIICTSIEGSVDIVTDGETGMLFPPGDAGALLTQLRSALADPDKMKEYAINLRMKIEKYFSQAYVHQCLKEKYLELLKKN